jgi:sugar lactone lactonase YvrE
MLVGSVSLASAGSAQPVLLNDSVRVVKQSAEAGPVDVLRPYVSRSHLKAAEASAAMTLELPLKLRNMADLEARVARGEHVSAQEFTQKYAPAAQDYQTVVDWAKGQGLTITRQDDHRLAVFVQGSVSQLAGILKVNFARVSYRGKEYTSAIDAPTISGGISNVILGITGLQPHLRPHKHLIKSAARPNLGPSGNGYYPKQVAQAYDLTPLYNSSISGSGQTIAIVIDTFPNRSDLQNFWTTCGISQSSNNITFIQTVTGSMGAPSGEETLDTEWASSIAPAAKVRVYGATDLENTDLDTTYQQVLDDAMGNPGLNMHEMTMSYGSGETDTAPSELQNDHQLFTALTAVGVTCFASAGDGGSTPDDNGGEDGAFQPENPAEDPSVNGVGGTSIVLNGSNNETSETVWNDGAQGGATGGGTSGTAEAGAFAFSRPAWQSGSGVNTTAARQCPDLAAIADPNTGGMIIFDGQQEQYGGTSLASPVCAAIFSLVNEARANAGQPALGLLGPHIYPLIGTSSFRDITSGTNETQRSPTKYVAGVGYDECTGVGAPLGAALEAALQGSSITATPLAEVTPGSSASFVVTGGGGSATYHWERQPIGSTGFTALTDNGTYSGATTATLTISSTTTAMSGDQFECVVSGSTTTSPASNLAVETPLAVSNVAGSAGQIGTTNGTGTGALFNYPSGVALDSTGNIYVADYGNNQIRKIAPGGVVTTPYGNVGGNAGASNGSGNNASFNSPNGVAIDSTNDLYVIDSGNNLVRKITGGVVSTLVSSSAGLNNPQGIAVDPNSGTIYVADTGNDVIRKVTTGGTVTILAGVKGQSGYQDGAAGTALFSGPEAVAVDSSGNVWVADMANCAIREISNGTVTTVAGGVHGGYMDGRASSALFNAPTGLAFDGLGNLYITDGLVPSNGPNATDTSSAASGNSVLRKLSAAGAVTTLAGNPGVSGSNVGTGTGAEFYSIQAVVCATNGAYVADTYNQLVRAIGSPTGGGVGSKPQATVTLSNLTAAYDGSPHGVTVTTNPSGLTVDVTYNGSTTVPTNAGSYTVVATVSDAVYGGSASGTLVISPLSATVTLGNLSPTYNGSAQAVSVVTSPSGLAVTVTYNGSSSVPISAGTYAVLATISQTNYSGSAQGTLTIAKAPATVTLSNLTATYDGATHAVTAVSNPAGLSVVVTYTVNGASTTKAPSVPGSYPVVGTISDTNYTGSGSGTLVINPGAAEVTLNGLAAVYNGKAHAVTATTTPSGLPVTITYNGGSAAPIAAGSYSVVGTVNSAYFAGSASGTLVISPIAPVVTTGAVSAITGTSATLAGSANPEGSATTFSFQYGLSSNPYSNSTTGQSLGSGSAVVASSAPIMGLTPGTLYHYRAVASSAGGTINGLDKTFTTLAAPTFGTTPATPLLSASGAEVGFAVDPEGVATSVYIRYSTDPNFGTYSQTSPQSIGAGKAPVNVSAFLSGLQPNVTYYYEAVTTSAAGMSTSLAGSFTTLGFDTTEVAATGAIYASLGNAAIDGSDEVAFAATLTGASTTANKGIWANHGSSTLDLVAQTGSDAPGAGGAVFATLTDPVYNNSADVAFGGTLKVATGLVTAATESGVWASSGGTLGLIAREGSAAPGTGGANFATFTAVGLSDDSGAIVAGTLTASTALGVNTTNNAGVWEGTTSSNLTLMLRNGEQTDSGKTIASFKFLPVETYVSGQTRGFSPVKGYFAADTTYTDKNTGIVKVTAVGSPTAVATSGDAAAGTSGAVFATFSSPAINDGKHVAFLATLKAAVGDTTTKNAKGIWADDSNSVRQLVARLGQVAPGTGTNATFLTFSDPVYNASEAVAFRGTLSVGTGLAPAAMASGIWSTSGGSLALVAQQGTQAPGCATGVKFLAFTELALDNVNGGGVLFLATLSGTGVTAANNTAIFCVDNNGTLQLVVRTGDVIGGKTITALAFLPAETTTNALVAGQERSFSASTGDLVYNATFSDKSTAIFNVVFP